MFCSECNRSIIPLMKEGDTSLEAEITPEYWRGHTLGDGHQSQGRWGSFGIVDGKSLMGRTTSAPKVFAEEVCKEAYFTGIPVPVREFSDEFDPNSELYSPGTLVRLHMEHLSQDQETSELSYGTVSVLGVIYESTDKKQITTRHLIRVVEEIPAAFCIQDAKKMQLGVVAHSTDGNKDEILFRHTKVELLGFGSRKRKEEPRLLGRLALNPQLG